MAPFCFMFYNLFMLSVIIPSRNERFLNKTIEDILIKAKGDIEVIVILDGYWDTIIDDKRVRAIHVGTPRGMRNAINMGVAIARGEHIMKCDGHVLFDEGFDIKLAADCQRDWIMVPRRKRLDAENWCIKDVGKKDVDYEYLSYPDNPADFGGPGLNGRIWEERAREKESVLIDDTPASQGSCWFMHKDYFHELELMDEAGWGEFWCESQELAFKCILSGGRYVVNKNTYYAHLHKGKEYGRGYRMSNDWLIKGRNKSMEFFAGHKVWSKQKYPLSYLIERFHPMPGWDDQKLAELKERESKLFK